MVCGSDDDCAIPRSTFYARRKRERLGFPLRSKGRPSQWGTHEEEGQLVIKILQTAQNNPVSARWLRENLPHGMSASVKTSLRWLRKWGFLLTPSSTPTAPSGKSVAVPLPVVHKWVPPKVTCEWLNTDRSWMVIVARNGRGIERFKMVAAESPEDETVQKAITMLSAKNHNDHDNASVPKPSWRSLRHRSLR